MTTNTRLTTALNPMIGFPIKICRCSDIIESNTHRLKNNNATRNTHAVTLNQSEFWFFHRINLPHDHFNIMLTAQYVPDFSTFPPFIAFSVDSIQTPLVLAGTNLWSCSSAIITIDWMILVVRKRNSIGRALCSPSSGQNIIGILQCVCICFRLNFDFFHGRSDEGNDADCFVNMCNQSKVHFDSAFFKQIFAHFTATESLYFSISK